MIWQDAFPMFFIYRYLSLSPLCWQKSIVAHTKAVVPSRPYAQYIFSIRLNSYIVIIVLEKKSVFISKKHIYLLIYITLLIIS